MRRILLPIATLAFASAAPAAAQAPVSDVRCLLASNMFAKAETDAGKKQFAAFASFFYLGRVDAKLSAAQLKAAILAEGKTMTGQTAGPVMNACAKQLQARQQSIQQIGQDIAKAQPK